MRTKDIGNGQFALEIPQELLSSLGWDEYTILDLEVIDGSLHIKEHIPTDKEKEAFQAYIKTPEGKEFFEKLGEKLFAMHMLLQIHEGGGTREEQMKYIEENKHLFKD
jgi:hypothetical protein